MTEAEALQAVAKAINNITAALYAINAIWFAQFIFWKIFAHKD